MPWNAEGRYIWRDDMKFVVFDPAPKDEAPALIALPSPPPVEPQPPEPPRRNLQDTIVAGISLAVATVLFFLYLF